MATAGVKESGSVSARQRLGVQDGFWLEMDKPGNLMVVDSLFWTATPIGWDRYKESVRDRFWESYAAFRSVVVKEGGSWFWEEQPDAELDERFEHVTLPAPGGEAELQALIAAERVIPLDRSEPLWRAVLVDGFHGGSAVLLRTHHAIADGIRMVQFALTTMDAGPDGGAVPAGDALRPTTPAAPSPAPSAPAADGASLVSWAWERGQAWAGTSLQLARSAVTNPVGAAHTAKTLTGSVVSAMTARVSRGGPAVPQVFAALPGDVDTARKLVLGTRNDSSSWTGAVSDEKAIAWSPPLALADVKAVARAGGATVNDVLVTCVAESLRRYLEKHHDVCHSVTWDVPVNLKPFDPDLPLSLGNAFAIVQLELPTNLEDPVRTLDVVRRRMDRIKAGHEALVDFGVQAAFSRLNKRLYRTAVDLIANRAVGVLTNVPGPRMPLYVAGQEVVGMLGWAPTTGNQVMSFTIFSYAGRVFVGIAADVQRVPDHQQIVDGFGEAFQRLALLTT
jgi:diacylglycerol O-acyltransferase